MVRDRISHAAIRARKDQNVPAAVVNSKNVIDLLLHIQNGFQCSKILPSFLVTHPGPFALKIINQTVFFFPLHHAVAAAAAVRAENKFTLETKCLMKCLCESL